MSDSTPATFANIPAPMVEYFGKTGLPEPALKPTADAVAAYGSLVALNNKWVAQISAAKAQDPNNTDYIDSLWKAEQAKGNEKVKEAADRFDAVAEEYEKLLAQLRKVAKENFVEPPLSEEATKELRKKVNDSAEAIKAARTMAIGMLLVPESMLKTLQVEIPDGGLATLLPAVEPLKNLKGRKGATESGTREPYRTRVGEVLLNDVSTTTKEGAANFLIAAEALSKQFGGDSIPDNKVSERELEAAMFEHLGIEFRSKKGSELDDVIEFVFEKNVKVQNPNDDSFKLEPRKVKVTVRSESLVKAEKEKAEAPAETPAPEKSEPVKVETPKVETKPEPAKKTSAPTQPTTQPTKK